MSKKSLSFAINLGVDSNEVKTGLDKVVSEFARLATETNKTLAGIKGFAELKKQIKETSAAQVEATQKVAAAAAALKDGGGKAAAKDFELAKKEAGLLKDTLAKQQQELQKLRTSLGQAGVSTRNMSASQKELRTNLDAAIKKYTEQARQSQAAALLGVRSSADTAAGVKKIRDAYATLASSGKLSLRELAQAKKAMGQKIDDLTGKTSLWRGSLSKVAGVLGALFAVRAIIGYANAVRKIADEYTNLHARLKLVTKSEAELQYVEASLYATAQQTGTAYADNAASYAKLGLAMKNSGASAAEVLNINELVNKSLIVSGASAGEASSFMLQFGQAMGSGVLQGDEFRAMMESNGYFAQQLAQALDTDIAGLRKMSKAGQLTTDVLREAFKKMGVEINDAFAKMPVTTARAMTALDNVYKNIIDGANKGADGTTSISESIIDLARTIDQNKEGIISLFSAIISAAASTVGAMANIGQSLAGWSAVGRGDLSFFSFATMNAQELNAWLKKNVAEVEKQKGAHKEVADAAKDSATEQKRVTGDALKEMQKQYKSYADEVKRLQDQIIGREQSLYDQLRGLARSGMSGMSAWQDLKQQAEEYEKKAREAAAAGDFKGAAEAADKAKEFYSQLNTEIKEGEQVLLSQPEALKVAMAGVERAGKLGIDALKQQQSAAHNAMTAMARENPLEDLSGAMDKTEQEWLKNWERMRAGAEKQVAAVEQKIVALTRDRRVTVYVNEVIKRASGGQIQHLAGGGRVHGFSPNDRADNVPIWATADEFMHPVRAVRHYGLGFMEAVRSLRFPKALAQSMANMVVPRISLPSSFYLASGGPVPRTPGPAPAAESINVNLTLPGGKTPVRVTADRANAGELLRQLARMQRLAS